MTIPAPKQGTQELGYMACDQFGNTLHMGDGPPRKWLLKHFCRKSAQKIYVDLKNGKSKHVGYIVAGHWCTVYRVFSLN